MKFEKLFKTPLGNKKYLNLIFNLAKVNSDNSDNNLNPFIDENPELFIVFRLGSLKANYGCLKFSNQNCTQGIDLVKLFQLLISDVSFVGSKDLEDALSKRDINLFFNIFFNKKNKYIIDTKYIDYDNLKAKVTIYPDTNETQKKIFGRWITIKLKKT